MFVSDSLEINANGHLTLSGVDTVELAKEYGTPLYAMSGDGIRKNCRAFKSAIDSYFGGNGLILYASKAFCCKEMCRISASEGLGLDVVSLGELKTALLVGFPPEKIFFHGNNKQFCEIEAAVEAEIGCIIADNFDELSDIEAAACARNKKIKVMLRVKPGIDAHTHEFIKTGQIDSKFGFVLKNGEAIEAVKKAIEYSHIELCGIHCHIGSQIFDEEPFEHAAHIMLEFLFDIRKITGKTLGMLDLGGGFGIKYLESDGAIPFENYIRNAAAVIKSECAAHDFPEPFLLFEPGRSIVGSEGITLYTVGSIKDIPNVRKYVSIDGGMGDNPRYALYNAPYTAVVASRAGEPAEETVTISGKCCESGDLIQKDCPIQRVRRGDILAVLSTGAYNYSMASNYNRIARPAAVMISDGSSRIVVKRETFDDMLALDV